MEQTNNHGSSVEISLATLHQTTTSKHNNNLNPDLISALPDSLLLHILSFLYFTKEVIQTSLLSRRWRYLWRSIPCLLFSWYKTKFIDYCLFYHEESKVQKLHITFCYEEDKHALLVDKWLHFAIKCKVEDFILDPLGDDFFLDLQYDYRNYTLPHSFYFLCTTLTSLTLRGCNLNLPDSFQLGSLKQLSLIMIELNPDSIEHFSSSCPLLEDIHLSDCNRERDLNIVITNEHVKRLEITWYGLYFSSSLKINAPTLLSLRIYYCYPYVMYHVENLASLMTVELTGDDSFDEYLFFNPDSVIKWSAKLLYDFSHVKHLKLLNQCLQGLSLMKLMSSDILSISATCLELYASLGKWELPGIRYLLESCSNLEKLKIVDRTYFGKIKLPDEFLEKHDFEEEEYWASVETDVPSIMPNINIKTDVLSLRF